VLDLVTLLDERRVDFVRLGDQDGQAGHVVDDRRAPVVVQ
jgi:hypothetical protein